MKKHLTTALFSVIFLAGLSLLLYPFISNEWNNYRQSRLISTYDETITSMEAANEIDYETEWEGAYAYNEALRPYILPDSFAVANATEEDEAYMSALNLTGDGMMGYVQIPKINVKLPIFHTTTEEVLQTAAGHLEGSSLPVGGEGTHAVISAHRGLPSATLFTDLDRLAEGDHFLLKILDDTLCYEVDQITVIEPDDTSALAAVEGEDLVTLLTCTPYGVNSHRLLVRGHRTEYTEAVDEEVAASPFLGGTSLHTSYLLWVIVGLLVTGVFIFLLYLYDKKKHRPQPDITQEDGSEETAEDQEAVREEDIAPVPEESEPASGGSGAPVPKEPEEMPEESEEQPKE
ncbi:MAG: class C sortase [Lachnospiraceae bacterium]|nr:class C sortase [Lachnospiraceae bacterium]